MRIRQHPSVEEENTALKPSPDTVGRAGLTPDTNLFCFQVVKPAFFPHYSLQNVPLESTGFPWVLSAPQPFPPRHHPSHIPQAGAHLKLLFLLLLVSFSPCFYLLPRAKAAESLSKHASGIKWPLSALFPPTGIHKETRIGTEHNSSQIAGFCETIQISTST